MVGAASGKEPTEGISVALSGGGHRASLFGLGVLLYLVDAGKNGDVSSIASVSGGSLTNAFVAQHVDYRTCSKSEFESSVARPMAFTIAERGTLFAAPLTWLFMLLVSLSAAAAVTVPFIVASPYGVAVGGGLLVVTFWLLWLRGDVCGAAYKKVWFSPNGRTTWLSEIDVSVDHVILATELRTARQVYFAPRFVYGYDLGHGSAVGVPLHKAVQASTAIPVGLTPASVRVPTWNDDLDGQRPMVLKLVDGGVYDNMADQWARGFSDRVARWPGLAHVAHAPQQCIVVNSSGRTSWQPLTSLLIPLWGEVAAIQRDMSVLYENTTAVRRQDLVRRFDEAATTGQGLTGALVMISQSPFAVPGYFAREETRGWPERQTRAKCMLQVLGDTESYWQSIAHDNTAVSTTLSALGETVSARLLYHGYCLAMANLHVLLGYPLVEMPELERFEKLVGSQQVAGEGDSRAHQ